MALSKHVYTPSNFSSPIISIEAWCTSEVRRSERKMGILRPLRNKHWRSMVSSLNSEGPWSELQITGYIKREIESILKSTSCTTIFSLFPRYRSLNRVSIIIQFNHFNHINQINIPQTPKCVFQSSSLFYLWFLPHLYVSHLT